MAGITSHTRLKEDFKVGNEWRISKLITHSPYVYEQVHSISGMRWSGIGKRCKVGSLEQKKHPNYIGCVNNYLDFQEFVEWSRSEVGYQKFEENGNAWCIDKDILGNRSKIYSPETCIFIPNRVNVFLTLRTLFRGEYPLGVSWKTKNNKFTAQMTYNGSNYLGLFEDPMEAHRAWQRAKIGAGREIAEPYKETHGKLYCGLNAWCDMVQADHDNYRETKF